MKLTKEEKILIGQRIKQIRREKGMTMEEFGNLLSTSKSIVYRWEIGTNLPNPERLKLIAKIADISVEELLYGNILRQYFNEHWTRLIKNKDTKKDYCTTHVVDTSKNYFITHIINTKEEFYNVDQKEFYNVNKKEFEYIKSNKERLYDIFYKNVLEYGYNENNNNNIRIFNLSVYMLLKEYYISQEENDFFHTTLFRTLSEKINQINLSILNATKQTTNVNDKLFINQLMEITEEYANQINKLFQKSKHNNE